MLALDDRIHLHGVAVIADVSLYGMLVIDEFDRIWGVDPLHAGQVDVDGTLLRASRPACRSVLDVIIVVTPVVHSFNSIDAVIALRQ